MNEYLLQIIGTVLLCSLLTAIMPSGKTAAVIKGMTRLACVLVIVAPVLNFFKSGSMEALLQTSNDDFLKESVISYDDEFIQYYSELRVRETERALEKELTREYSLNAKVTLLWQMETEAFANAYSMENIRIKSIRVETQEEVQEEIKQKIYKYLTKKYCSEVLIE